MSSPATQGRPAGGEPFESDFSKTGRIDYSDQSTNIDDKTITEMKELAGRYPQARSALIPMLHLVQSVDGRISPAGIQICAQILGITTAQVVGVATFYTMFKRKPAGKHHIGVCKTALCAVMGGDELMEHVSQQLGIHDGETTPDGKFSLEAIECNAACDYAPVMMVNWEFMDNMTPDKADKLLDDLAADRPVQASRGATITSWREAERVLAGFPDGRADEGPVGGEASIRGTLVAKQHGWMAPDPDTVVPGEVPTGPGGPNTLPNGPAEAARAADEGGTK
jgi:NADH-quinone oxidoreductase subunit E